MYILLISISYKILIRFVICKSMYTIIYVFRYTKCWNKRELNMWAIKFLSFSFIFLLYKTEIWAYIFNV